MLLPCGAFSGGCNLKENTMAVYKRGSHWHYRFRVRRVRYRGALPEARTKWEQRNPGTWDKFKNAARYAWDRARDKV